MADYADLIDLKSFMNIPDDVDDDLLEVAITASSAVIDQYCGQTFDPVVPDAVKLATLLQASRFVTRRNAPFGVTGSPEQGGEMRLLAKLDPDVAVLLRPYKVFWAAY